MDDVHVDVAAVFQHFVHDRAEQQAAPARLIRLSNEHLGDVARPRVVEDRAGHVLPGERYRLRPQSLGQAEVLGDLLLDRLPAVAGVSFHRDGDPRGVEGGRHRLAVRITRAVVGLGPTQTSSRSAVAQGE